MARWKRTGLCTRSLAALAFSIVASMPGVGLTQSKDGQAKEVSGTLNSLFDAVRHNAEAIQTCDVILKKRVFFDSVKEVGNKENAEFKGVLATSEMFQRLSADFSRQRFANVTSMKVQDFDIEYGDAKGEGFQGQIADFGKGKVFKYLVNDRPRVIDIAELQSVMPNWNKSALGFFEDPRSFGTLPNTWGKPWPNVANRLQELGAGVDIVESGLKNNRGKVVYTSYNLPEKGWKGRHEVTFDLDSNTIVRVLAEGWSESELNPTWGFEFEQEIEWEEHAGIMVPISFRERRPSVRRNRKQEVFLDFDIIDVKLHWISINDDLDESCFDGTSLNDAKAIKKWLDPRICKADRLIDGPPKAEQAVPVR